MKIAQGTKIEIDGYNLSSVSSVNIKIDPNDLIMASISIPIDSIELIDGKQVIKLAGKLVKVVE